MTPLSIRNIHKSFGDIQALGGITFDVKEGEIVAILGPSGCGKSTLLEIIAGLEEPDQGAIYWQEVDLESTPPHQRGFGLMFQDYALFPHKNVQENVAFGLQMTNWIAQEIHGRVSEVLNLVGLPEAGTRNVATLSGGEQQRVALARSLAPRPRLLMLDEPLGSLDRTLRERLIVSLRDILLETKQTALYVTHDQEEAFMLANRVLIMDAGKIIQMGTPQEIYRQPASPFVANFLGLSNLFRGIADGKHIETPIGIFAAPEGTIGTVTVLLRPDRVSLGDSKVGKLTGRLLGTSFRGYICHAEVEINNQRLIFNLPSDKSMMPNVGETIELSFNPTESIQIFKP